MVWLPLAEVQGSCNVFRAGPWPPFPIPTSLGSSNTEGLCTHREKGQGAQEAAPPGSACPVEAFIYHPTFHTVTPRRSTGGGGTGPWTTDSAGSHGDEVASKWIRCLGTSARETRYSNALPSQGFHNSAFLSATLSNRTITKVTWIYTVSHI